MMDELIREIDEIGASEEAEHYIHCLGLVERCRNQSYRAVRLTQKLEATLKETSDTISELTATLEAINFSDEIEFREMSGTLNLNNP